MPDIAEENKDTLSEMVFEIPAPDNTKMFYWNTETKDVNPIEMKEVFHTTGTSYIKDNKVVIQYVDNEKYLNYRLLFPNCKIMTSVCTKALH